MKITGSLLFLYLLAVVAGVFLSGAGHGPGIAFLFYIAFPASLLGEIVQPDDALFLIIILGAIQWTMIGVVGDLWRRARRRTKSQAGAVKPKEAKAEHEGQTL